MPVAPCGNGKGAEITHHFRPGNRSALDWVIDQYQVSVDKRSGIRSDPNRADDPEYIVRLAQHFLLGAKTRVPQAVAEDFAFDDFQSGQISNERLGR